MRECLLMLIFLCFPSICFGRDKAKSLLSYERYANSFPYIEEMEYELKQIEGVEDAVVWAWDESVWLEYCFSVELVLKDGDIISFMYVTKNLNFYKNKGGIEFINDFDFTHCIYSEYPAIPCKYLSYILKTDYNSVLDVVKDYERVRSFLLDTPYKRRIFNTGFFFYYRPFWSLLGVKFYRY